MLNYNKCKTAKIIPGTSRVADIIHSSYYIHDRHDEHDEM